MVFFFLFLVYFWHVIQGFVPLLNEDYYDKMSLLVFAGMMLIGNLFFWLVYVRHIIRLRAAEIEEQSSLDENVKFKLRGDPITAIGGTGAQRRMRIQRQTCGGSAPNQMSSDGAGRGTSQVVLEETRLATTAQPSAVELTTRAAAVHVDSTTKKAYV